MIRLYVKLVMFLIITRWGSTAPDCPPSDKNKLHAPNPPSTGDKNRATDEVKTEITGKPKRPKSRCCPYDFDPSQCKVVGDRVLCGYNRNVGGYPNENVPIELQNGCRIRNNRLECGYVVGPFTNPRRPPAGNVNLPQYDDTMLEKTALQKDFDKNSGEIINEKERLKQMHPIEATTRCLEIKERIVCRQ